MANRYNELLDSQKYVETYVPLPLSIINQAGAAKQKDLDLHKKNLSEDSDPLNKIGNLSFTLKKYDRNNNIVDESNTELEDYKQSTIKQLASERDQLAGDLASGKISDTDFKAKSFQHIKKATNAYNELAGYKTNVDAIAEANKEYAKSEAFGLDQGYGTNMLEYNTNYLDNARKGSYDSYSQQAIAKEFDIQTAIKNYTFKDAGGNKVTIGDYITSSGSTGVKAERVRDAAERIFSDENSDVYRNARRSLQHDIRMSPGKYKTQADVEKAWKEKQLNFVQASVDEHAGTIYKEDAKANSFALQKQRFDREDATAAPMAQTGASDEYAGLIDNPKYADYIKVGADGTKEIDFIGLAEAATNGKNPSAWTELGRGVMQGLINVGSLGMNNGSYLKEKQYQEGMTASEFKNKLESIMKDKASIIQYDKEIIPSNYNDILNKSKDFEKLRGLSLIYEGNQGDVYSDFINDAKTAYTFIDPTTNTTIAPDNENYASIMSVANKVRVVSRTSRPGADGKGAESVLRVQLVSKDDKLNGQTYFVRENKNESNKLFDGLFDVTNAGMEFIRTGTSQNKLSYSKETNEKVQTSVKDAFDNSPSLKGLKFAAINHDPGDSNYVIVSVYDKDRKNQQTIRMTAGPDGKMKIVPFIVKNNKGQAEQKVSLPMNMYMSVYDQEFNLSQYGGEFRRKSMNNGQYKTGESEIVEEGISYER